MSIRESEGIHYVALSEDPTVVLMEHEGRQALISRKLLKELTLTRSSEYVSDDGLVKDGLLKARDAVALEHIAAHGFVAATTKKEKDEEQQDDE